MRNRLWLIYGAIASVATLAYFVTGHVSYVINIIGLSSPVMIVVALRIWKPEKRLLEDLLAAVHEFVDPRSAGEGVRLIPLLELGHGVISSHRPHDIRTEAGIDRL